MLKFKKYKDFNLMLMKKSSLGYNLKTFNLEHMMSIHYKLYKKNKHKLIKSYKDYLYAHYFDTNYKHPVITFAPKVYYFNLK